MLLTESQKVMNQGKNVTFLAA